MASFGCVQDLQKFQVYLEGGNTINAQCTDREDFCALRWWNERIVVNNLKIKGDRDRDRDRGRADVVDVTIRLAYFCASYRIVN